MHLDPVALSPTDRYKILIGGITPRPIAWVSTLSPDGRPNLAPFSFFAGASSTPMALVFCPANKPDGTEKDTLRNCKPASEGGTGEFVVSVVPEALGHLAAVCGEPLAYGESEWLLAGVEPAPSARVRPPRVAASPLAFECRTERVIRLVPGEGEGEGGAVVGGAGGVAGAGVPGGGNVVIGRVVSVYVREDAIDGRLHIDPAVLDTVGRMGGSTYVRTRERFDLPFGAAGVPTGPRA